MPGRHITAALGGQPGEPLSPAERIERERVRTLIQTVASCCNTLAIREPTAERRAELAFYDGELRRCATMTAAERQDVIRTYPDRLRRLRLEIDA